MDTSTPESSASMLLVDDEEVFRGRLARALRERGLEVVEAGDHAGATAAVAAHPLTYALVDLRLPSGSGLDVVRTIKRERPHTAVVVLTGYGSIATALEAVRLGAMHYLTKPASVDDILAGFAPSPVPGQRGNGAEHDVPSLDRVEWEHINRVLTDCNGNVSEAARRLGIHRRSLQRKLAKYPVRR
jgi:two-component system response regulator RegA